MVVRISKREANTNHFPFLEESRVKLLARIENLQKVSLDKGMKDIYAEVSTIATTEHDMHTVSLLDDPNLNLAKTKVDIAQLSKQTVERKKAYFEVIGVRVDYSLINFGKDDIQPLVPINFPINPEEFTGPFFTVECQVSLTNTLIAKLLEVAALATSNMEYRHVQLGVERDGNKGVIVTVSTTTHGIAKEELEDLFISNYRKLAEKMSIRLGSGLEGYIVKNIVHRLNLPFKYELSENGDLEFIITFPKN